MTKEELNRRRMMFQINAKRNELLKPENTGSASVIRHSATNDFLAFRKKVAAGMKKQKEQNAEVFNVTAANLQNYQDMLDNNEIIHAGTSDFKSTYYQKVENAFGPGKHRYFYSKEEWDAYQNKLAGYRKKADEYVKNRDANSNAGANRGAKEGADAKNKALANKAQEAFTRSSADYKNKELADKAQEAFTKSSADYKNKELANKAQEAFTKSTVDYKNKDLANKAQEAFNNSPAANTEFRTSTDAYKNKDLLESNQKSKENAVKRSDPKYQKELEKAKSIKEDKDRWGAYSESDLKEISKDKRFSNIKTEDDAVNYPGGVEKLYNDLEAALEEKFPEKKKNYEAAKNAGADRGAKESEAANSEKEKKANEKKAKLEEQQNKREEAAKSGTKTTESYTEQVKRNTDFAKEAASTNDDGSLDEEGKEYVDWVKEQSLKDLKTPERHQMEKDIVKDATKPGTTIDDLSSKYGIPASDIRTVLWFNGIKKPAEDKRDLDTRRHNNVIANKWSKEDAIANSKKGVKHDGLEDGITTSTERTPEQEYIAFRKKVEAGMKHFGLNRNLMSVPKNQALADGNSMSHAGTYKYYQKIDLPSGETRYFYTKEEWDAFNNDVKKKAKEGQTYQKWRLDKGHQYDDENTATGIAARKAKMKNTEKNGASNLTKKEGFVAKSLTPTAKAIGNKIADDISNDKHIPESERNAIKMFAKSTEKEWQKKFEERDYNTRHNLPENYPFKNEFKELDDDIWDVVGKDTDKKLISSYLKDGGIKEAGEILKDFKDDIFSQTEEELSKREKSIESFNNMKKSFNKIKIIEDDTDNLSKYEKQLLADELGISEWSEENLAKKYGIDENSAKDPGDDYGASNFDKLAEAYDAFWNDYKAAKKAISSSASKAKEED